MRLTQQALDRWDLKRDPFNDEPHDFQELFWSQAHLRLRDYILSVVQRYGTLAVSAPVGWGKSVLWMAIEDLLNNDPRTGYMVARVRTLHKRAITANTLQMAVIRDLDGEIPAATSSERVSEQCEKILRARFQRNKRVVLIVDEAHRLTGDALRAIKNLQDVRSGLHHVLAIVLLGQEELVPLLKQYRLREVGARIELVTPDPLSIAEGEVRDYIRWRFALARFDRCPAPLELESMEIPFDETGLAQVEAELSGGPTGGFTPSSVRPDLLAINAVCSHSLAFAADCGLDTVTEDIVRRARAKMLQGV